MAANLTAIKFQFNISYGVSFMTDKHKALHTYLAKKENHIYIPQYP